METRSTFVFRFKNRVNLVTMFGARVLALDVKTRNSSRKGRTFPDSGYEYEIQTLLRLNGFRRRSNENKLMVHVVMLATGFSSRKTGSTAGAVHVGFVVVKAMLDKFLLVFRLFPAILLLLQYSTSSGVQAADPSKSAACYEYSLS